MFSLGTQLGQKRKTKQNKKRTKKCFETEIKQPYFN